MKTIGGDGDSPNVVQLERRARPRVTEARWPWPQVGGSRVARQDSGSKIDESPDASETASSDPA